MGLRMGYILHGEVRRAGAGRWETNMLVLVVSTRITGSGFDGRLVRLDYAIAVSRGPVACFPGRTYLLSQLSGSNSREHSRETQTTPYC